VKGVIYESPGSLAVKDIPEPQPRQVPLIESLPKTPTGKITKAELQRAYNKAELEAENVSLEEATPYLKEDILLEKQSAALLEFLGGLRQNATVVIILEEAKQDLDLGR